MRIRPVCRPPLLVGAAVVAVLATAMMPAPATADERPNVVVVMTDDQAVHGMRVLTGVRRLIGRRGTRFRHSFTEYPLCCPSRATFLTGRYSHNHGVRSNQPPTGGYSALDSSETLPVWLERAGYRTAHVGKYLNGYGWPTGDPTTVPPGWTRWHGAVDPTTYRFYNYTLNENGRLVHYGGTPADYQTDVFTEKAVERVRRWAPLPRPFFLSVSYLAPHTGDRSDGPMPETPGCKGFYPRPAPRDSGAFAERPLPRPPSFNEERIFDKPKALRRPKLDDGDIFQVATMYRCRLASLLAVDDGVRRIVRELRRAGELRRTLIIFTSDNGYQLGEHRIKWGKNHVYDESLRVPLLLRGPGIPARLKSKELAVNADIAPTILDAAGAEAPVSLDGSSLLRIVEHPRRRRGRAFPLTTATARGVRTARYTYARHPQTGEVELYDNRRDPFQLRNRAGAREYSAARRRLALLADRLAECAGAGCRLRPRLEIEVRRRPRCRARIAGADADQIDSVRWRLRGRPAGSGPALRLPTGRGGRLVAVVALIDGRVVRERSRIRACRR